MKNRDVSNKNECTNRTECAKSRLEKTPKHLHRGILVIVERITE